jgi:5'-3' exonuclease
LYLEKPIEYDWYYPWEHVPLYDDIINYIPRANPIVYNIQPPLDPEQQLAIVLPLQSIDLLENVSLKNLVILYPQYYPTAFGYSSLGKKWFYECESSIPIFPSSLLRGIIGKL